MFERVQIWLQYIIPQHGLSRLMGAFASRRCGWLTTAFTRWFINRYQVDMSEAKQPDPAAYATFNEFFTRELKPGARPMLAGDAQLAQPVDGAISQLGPIREGRIFQAKGFDYSAESLLADASDAATFTDGQFATIYLSPRDYHRIHMPIAGTLRKMTYVPGALFSVNQNTVANVPELFARNERVVALFDTAVGPMAMVLVGATIVASIETVWSGTVTPPTGSDVFSWRYPNDGAQAIHLDKGAEMGRFKLGSTVILLFGKDALSFADSLEPGSPVRLGEVLAEQAQAGH